MMTLHFLSGPLALAIDLAEIFTFEFISYGTSDSPFLGSFFFFLKVFTTPSVKGILRGTFHIF
jgi:hypothetical protein